MRLVATDPERLDRFLARALPGHSRSKLASLASAGAVLVDGAARKPSFLLQPGMFIEVPEIQERAPHDLTPVEIPLDVRYEDQEMLVVNKQRGLATHPAASLRSPSLVNALLALRTPLSSQGETFRPGIVHRLDKDTTGLILVAKTDAAHAALARQIQSKTAERRYVAVVAGVPLQERFDIDAPISRDRRNRLRMAIDPSGKPALTHVKVLGRIQESSVLAVRLDTGRTHQIRVHLSAIGHPVLGDRLYAPKDLQGVPLQLHAALLAFGRPRDGERIVVFAEPPGDFIASGPAIRDGIENW